MMVIRHDEGGKDQVFIMVNYFTDCTYSKILSSVLHKLARKSLPMRIFYVSRVSVCYPSFSLHYIMFDEKYISTLDGLLFHMPL